MKKLGATIVDPVNVPEPSWPIQCPYLEPVF